MGQTLLIKNLVAEYGDSLLRMTAEKDLQKQITERAVNEAGVTATAFKRAATAHWKDKVSDLRDECTEQIDLLDTLASA